MDKNRLDQFCPPGSASTAVRLAVPQDCASRGEGGALGNAVRGGEEATELSNNHLIVTQPGSSPISFCHGCGTAQRPYSDSDRFCADCGPARPGPIGSISVQVQETSGCVALTSPGESLLPTIVDPAGHGLWEAQEEPKSGKVYWVNHFLKQTTWEPPASTTFGLEIKSLPPPPPALPTSLARVTLKSLGPNTHSLGVSQIKQGIAKFKPHIPQSSLLETEIVPIIQSTTTGSNMITTAGALDATASNSAPVTGTTLFSPSESTSVPEPDQRVLEIGCTLLPSPIASDE